MSTGRGKIYTNLIFYKFFLSTSIAASISPGPLSARQRNAIKMAFCWRVDGGRLLDVTGICICPDMQVFCTQICDLFRHSFNMHFVCSKEPSH